MALAEQFVWDEESYLRAAEAGAFGEAHVEMVEGKVIQVVIGAWHGQVVMNLAHLLRCAGWRVTNGTLPASGSLPDPDLFVFRRGAAPVGSVGERLGVRRWEPGDVGLVVEVAETSWALDTGVKAKLYGRAGYPCYWVVGRQASRSSPAPATRGTGNGATSGPMSRSRCPTPPIRRSRWPTSWTSTISDRPPMDGRWVSGGWG